MQQKMTLSVCAAATVVLAAGMLRADVTSYSTDFDSMTPGSIYGQEGWVNLSSSNFPYDQQVTTAASHGGTQSWMVSNDVADGSVRTIGTPTFAPVGESSTVFGGHPSYNEFTESFWFRTVSTTSDPGLYISNSLGTAASVRNTWVGIQDDGSGNLIVNAFGTDSSGNFTENPSTAPLQWGQWYQIKEDAIFNDGPNNDTVRYQVLDGSGNVLMDSTINSWESYYANDPTAEQSPGPVASNQVSWGLAASPGVQGIYVDDLSLAVSNSPEPASLGVMGLASLALLRRRRR